MAFPAKQTKADDVRKIALSALSTVLGDGKVEAPSKPGLTGVRAVATGAVLYTAGRAVVTGRRFIRDRMGADTQEAEGEVREDEDVDDEEFEEPEAEEFEEPEAEEEEDEEEEDFEEPEAEEEEDEEEEDFDEPEAEEEEDEEDEDYDEPEAEEDEEDSRPRRRRRSAV
ncbi:MAG: hypothetical protein QOC68_2647 [Solirubrobacteraceae bacterium]|nr:hypothetical protein [Solirubrobacteraceae bacterium]